MTIILIGESNGVMVNGLSKGLRESANNNGFDFYNYSLGGTTSIYNLYILEKHKDIIEKSDLIISISNTNEIGKYNNKVKLPLSIIEKNIRDYYSNLYKTGKKILVLIMNNFDFCDSIVNNIHRYYICYYGFNYIDFNILYNQFNLKKYNNFLDSLINKDNTHVLDNVMFNLGCDIVNNRHVFKSSAKNRKIQNNKFYIIENFVNLKNSEYVLHKNSVFEENCIRIENGEEIKLDCDLHGKYLLAIHAWSDIGKDKEFTEGGGKNNYASSILINHTDGILVKNFACINQFNEFNSFLRIDDNFKISHNNTLKPTESTQGLGENVKLLNFFDIIACFVTDNIDLYTEEFILATYSDTAIKDFTNVFILTDRIMFFVKTFEEYIFVAKSIFEGNNQQDKNAVFLKDNLHGYKTAKKLIAVSEKHRTIESCASIIFDLGDSIKIKSLIFNINNFRDENLKHINIFLSIDRKNWYILPKKYLVDVNKLNKINYELNYIYKARYIKAVTETYMDLTLLNLEVMY